MSRETRTSSWGSDRAISLSRLWRDGNSGVTAPLAMRGMFKYKWIKTSGLRSISNYQPTNKTEESNESEAVEPNHKNASRKGHVH